MPYTAPNEPRLKLCQAILADGTLVDVRQSGSVFPSDDMALWFYDETPHKVFLARHTYPMTRDHMAIVGDRLVTEPARTATVPYGQRIVASGWNKCLRWLAEHAVLDTITSPILLEAVERLGQSLCLPVQELPGDAALDEELVYHE